jgi:hypothetical protein
MQTEMLFTLAGALAIAVVALVVYHGAVVRPGLANVRRLLEIHDGLIAGDGGTAAGRLRALEDGATEQRDAMGRLRDRVQELHALAESDLSNAGFVRYDAFAGNSAGLSYALALLNRQGDGVVLTSIYSREDTRTYGKPVEKYKPTVAASAEELEAIERARPQAS